MPWTKDDVERHNKGLTDHEKDIWVRVANDALKRCEKEGGSGCDAAAVRQANAAVRREKAEASIVMAVRDAPEDAPLETIVIDEEKGISALRAGQRIVEYYFQKTPNNWTEEHARAWMNHRFIYAAAVAGVMRLPDEELPPEVIEAREKLREIDGSEPFIRRVELKVGRFVIGNGKKVHFTQRFYDTFGPMYANKPGYRGHDGFGGSDDRERFGIILAYQNVEGKPHFWLYINDKEVIKNIQLTEALGITADEDVPYGQLSIEAEMIRGQKDADGYQEPMELSPNNMAIALVTRAGATGTRIERIAANSTNPEDTMDDKEKQELIAALSADEVRGHGQFEAAFAARLAELLWTPLDDGNPLTAALADLIEGRGAEVKAIADKINDGAVKVMALSDMRYEILKGVTAEELPWIPSYAGAVAALSAEQVKGLPAFTDALAAMKAEEIAKLPSVEALLAERDKDIAPGMKMVASLIANGAIAAAAGAPAGTVFGVAPEPKGDADAEKKAILAKARTMGFRHLTNEEVGKGGAELMAGIKSGEIVSSK